MLVRRIQFPSAQSPTEISTTSHRWLGILFSLREEGRLLEGKKSVETVQSGRELL